MRRVMTSSYSQNGREETELACFPTWAIASMSRGGKAAWTGVVYFNRLSGLKAGRSTPRDGMRDRTACAVDEQIEYLRCVMELLKPLRPAESAIPFVTGHEGASRVSNAKGQNFQSGDSMLASRNCVRKRSSLFRWACSAAPARPLAATR